MIKKYYDKSDLFCIPSRSESFAISALEAIACGIPVAASNVGGLNDLVIDGFNGFLFKTQSPLALRDTILKAKHTIWDYKGIADWAQKNYGWNKWVSELLSEMNAKK